MSPASKGFSDWSGLSGISSISRREIFGRFPVFFFWEDLLSGGFLLPVHDLGEGRNPPSERPQLWGTPGDFIIVLHLVGLECRVVRPRLLEKRVQRHAVLVP
ncbi:hypothetical protein TNIN_318411 [Trichonephila inaurata madagascariensis]|uniref:Uncharacterized protein n=1 Tax=Trichonephila inaurata madagascariensis TaxID=2747483 RepID=A0A8X6YQ73_9ARAC|nr:hypothetical protein TNIN_318411 [Trichonephila inaurata madagascariensis]